MRLLTFASLFFNVVNLILFTNPYYKLLFHRVLFPEMRYSLSILFFNNTAELKKKKNIINIRILIIHDLLKILNKS